MAGPDQVRRIGQRDELSPPSPLSFHVLLGDEERHDISLDRAWECMRLGMRRFSLLANSTFPAYRPLARRWLGLGDEPLAQRFDQHLRTGQGQLFTLRVDIPDPYGEPVEDWDDSFYGKFEYVEYVIPVRRRKWKRTMTAAFIAASYEGLHGADHEAAQIEWEQPTAMLADRAVNYFVKNCAHELVHLVGQGITGGNFHNYKGPAREHADMDADNLSNIFLASAYGLSVVATGLDVENQEIVELLGQNRSNKMFTIRASRRGEPNDANARYLRMLSNHVSGRLLSSGYAAARLATYLGAPTLHMTDQMHQQKADHVIVVVNETYIPTGVMANPDATGGSTRTAHFAEVAQAVLDTYSGKVRRNANYKSQVEKELRARLRQLGVALAYRNG